MNATAHKPARRSADAGIRVELIPAQPPHHTDDGRIAVPLWVLHDEKHLGDAEMLLSPQEAEQLVDRLHSSLATGGLR